MTAKHAFTQLKHSSDSAEWYTPPQYLEAMREVFGRSIELDPASSEAGNAIVQAERFFTHEDDGLAQPWVADTLFCNPPKSERGKHKGTADFQAKLDEAYRMGHVRQAILLVFNVATETSRMQSLFGHVPISLPDHRIKFIPPEGKYADAKKNSPLNGSAFVYWGYNNRKFMEVFGQFGAVIPPYLKPEHLW